MSTQQIALAGAEGRPRTGAPAAAVAIAARPAPDTLHFERFEFKYLIPESTVGAIRRFVQPYVRTDVHAAANPRGRYAIHNIYLDTPRLDFYTSCIHDAADRVKLRIRWYDEAAEGPFFLEVKRKVRRVIVKDRVRITREELDQILLPGGAAELLYHARPDVRPFLSRMTYTGARPTIFVRYTREPYESVFGRYARVTFDRAICFQDVGGLQLPENPSGWCYADGAWATKGVRTATILELKTTNDIPRWMSDLVAEFGLQRVGYSKYATSMTHRAESAWRRMDSHRVATARS